MTKNARKKYKVSCGALVTVFRRRTFLVTADSAEEAEEKARDMFRKAGAGAGWDVDSVEVDDIEEV